MMVGGCLVWFGWLQAGWLFAFHASEIGSTGIEPWVFSLPSPSPHTCFILPAMRACAGYSTESKVLNLHAWPLDEE